MTPKIQIWFTNEYSWKENHWGIKSKRFLKVAWIWFNHLHWKFKLGAGKFALGIKAKHCWALSTNFLFVEISQQCFAILPQVKFPANNLNFWRWWHRIQAICLHLFYFENKITQNSQGIRVISTVDHNFGQSPTTFSVIMDKMQLSFSLFLNNGNGNQMFIVFLVKFILLTGSKNQFWNHQSWTPTPWIRISRQNWFFFIKH